MKAKFIRYYVEGETEEKLVNLLKTSLNLIKPGKVHVLNPVKEKIKDAHLLELPPATMVVLIFDTDVDNRNILDTNIRKLRKSPHVTDVVTIPQVYKLEDEIINATNITNIKDLLHSRSNSEFKHDFINESKLETKLLEHEFDIGKLWCKNPTGVYEGIENQAEKIKMK